MKEENVSRRGWVKNAAIIFLSVMLVLTFFSQTIMNHSLPEAAVQMVESGSINTKIRGTGIVTATENYEVTMEQVREVATVPVKTGDTVSAGDILFTLSDGESEELEAARDALYDMQIQYQQALVNATGSDYAEENREIEKTRVRLNEALAKQRENYVTDDDLEDAEDDVLRYTEEIADLNDELNMIDPELDPDAYDDLKDDIRDAEDDLRDAEKELAKLEEMKIEYDSVSREVKELEETLSDQIFALEQQQNADALDQQITDLDLASMRRDIESQQRKVAELEEDTVDAVITAPIAGLVTEINVSAGGMTSPGTALAVIEVPDLGYSVSFPVTVEQAKKVKVGDPAEVSNNYWGQNISATLTSIKPDPENPGKGRLLVFSLDGEVDSGSQLNVSIGQKSANYDRILPNSALRSDSNGYFVLIIESKSTPLGTRYKAQRVDVELLAQDDNNAAVSGGISDYDYVLTSATAPVESGQYVRLAE